MDGASFYTLVTGEFEALKNFYEVLPQVIEDIFKNDFNVQNFQIADKKSFAEIFHQAFG